MGVPAVRRQERDPARRHPEPVHGKLVDLGVRLVDSRLLDRDDRVLEVGGDLLERYVYSEIRENPKELATAAAFSPSERWGDGKGLFSRIARS